MREVGINTIRSKTCRTIAAAPLRPPPRARLRAPFRSNYKTEVSEVESLEMSSSGTHVNIGTGIYPAFDKDYEDKDCNDTPEYSPSVPAGLLALMGIFVRLLIRLVVVEQRRLFIIVYLVLCITVKSHGCDLGGVLKGGTK